MLHKSYIGNSEHIVPGIPHRFGMGIVLKINSTINFKISCIVTSTRDHSSGYLPVWLMLAVVSRNAGVVFRNLGRG